MKQRLLIAVLFISLLIAYGEVKVYGADTDTEILINHEQEIFTINAVLPELENLYPGYTFEAQALRVCNQSQLKNFKLYLQITQDLFELESQCIGGEVVIQHAGGATTYSLSELSEGVELALSQDEIVRIVPKFELVGEAIGNESQNSSGIIRYQLTFEGVPTVSEPTKPTEQSNRPSTPQTGDEWSILTLLCSFFIIIIVQLLKKSRGESTIKKGK
jgi:hypothetical protein